MNQFGSWIANSALNEFALSLLANVPGLPPVLQTIHLLSIAAIMASAVMFNLRALGLAVPSQNLVEMATRLRAWAYWAVLTAFCSGVLFVLARPGRYFDNPVFQIKFALLLPAVVFSDCLFRLTLNRASFWLRFKWQARLAALLSLLLWIGVVLAGRWIAYSEYLFWP